MGEYLNWGEDGILYNTLPERFTPETASNYIKELSQTVNPRKDIRQLIDASKLNYLPNDEAKTILVEGVKKLRPPCKNEKNAIYGMTAFTRIATRMIITLAQRNDIKIFEAKKEALEWLIS
ncbi:MAG: hypothetical protein DKM50_02215 [Candidatus Margulisiibacteriota bacterium]|nr:MAG: hypothetical protein A2X41_05660 [Candidatus Margulisbacteria bacterium GWE2_39_32]PZM83530.1 MAG: hypothetical protein DKM50_02215 [Candidatus Margulisiibacteriota bacterium]HCT85333.1 hypothetical protein [Candidatus Margulisiibacteriota bacterium]HCY37141.1 hypothetical protein [Candidatus Margulisiibacteriota bacterium]